MSFDNIEDFDFSLGPAEDLLSWLVPNHEVGNLTDSLAAAVECAPVYENSIDYRVGSKRSSSSMSDAPSSASSSHRADYSSTSPVNIAELQGSMSRKKAMKMEALEARIKEVTQGNTWLQLYTLIIVM